MPEIGQAHGGRPVSTLATHGHVGEQAVDPSEHLMDQVSAHSLDIESEAQVARATLERGETEIWNSQAYLDLLSLLSTRTSLC